MSQLRVSDDKCEVRQVRRGLCFLLPWLASWIKAWNREKLGFNQDSRVIKQVKEREGCKEAQSRASYCFHIDFSQN